MGGLGWLFLSEIDLNAFALPGGHLRLTKPPAKHRVVKNRA
jgi:hypothetical protein